MELPKMAKNENLRMCKQPPLQKFCCKLGAGNVQDNPNFYFGGLTSCCSDISEKVVFIS